MALGGGDPAAAAATRVRFRIQPQPYPEALLDLAQQANVTLIGAAACPGVSRSPVAGAMTVEEALSRLLAGAACDWRMVAAGAVEISPARQAEAPRPPPPGPPAVVGELLVTATKRVRDSRELAVGITAIHRQRLRETGASDPSDAAAQMAGVLTTNLGPGRNKLLLRGLADGVFTGRARSTVATYLDDLPVNYNAPDPNLRLVDVERVEVARGPQGALYGAGAMSGVYRIVTRKPDLGQWSAEARVTGATTTGGGPSGAVEAYVNVPLAGDRAGLRLSAYNEVQGGYLDDIVQNRSNVDRTERQGGRLTVLAQPRDALSITVTGAAQRLRSEDTHYTIRGIGRKRAVLIPEPHENDIELVTGTARYSWGGAELTSSTGFVRHSYGSLFDATPVLETYTDNAETLAYSERTRTRMLVQDIVLTSRGASKLKWLAGLYASEARLRSPSELLAQNPDQPNVPVYSERRRETIRELAGYAEISYEPAPGWMLALGGRLYDIERRIRSDVVAERFDPRSQDSRNHYTGISPKISLQRRFDNGDLVYAVMSEGFRPGGVNTGGPATAAGGARDLLVRPAAQLRARAEAGAFRSPAVPELGALLRRLEGHPDRPVPGVGHPLHDQRRRRARAWAGGRGRVPHGQRIPRPAERARVAHADNQGQPRVHARPGQEPPRRAADFRGRPHQLRAAGIRGLDDAAGRPGDLCGSVTRVVRRPPAPHGRLHADTGAGRDQP